MPGRRVDERRVKMLTEGRPGEGPVVYWMSRDQRAEDNWALLHAQDLALSRSRPLVVVFCLAPTFLGATWRQYSFMLEGLRELEASLVDLNIGFRLLTGEAPSVMPGLVSKLDPSTLVTDFDPLRQKVRWQEEVVRSVNVPVHEVDAHNVVPCRVASDRREWAAYTLRPKLHRLLPEFLVEMPSLREHGHSWVGCEDQTDWERAKASLNVDMDVVPVGAPIPGVTAAIRALGEFLVDRLDDYAEARSDPSRDGTSRLSPFLHFGHLSAQRVALEVSSAAASTASKEAFLEELIVRRELADNFCLHTPVYDSPEAFPQWAQRTLDDHAPDQRERLYSFEELEEGSTDDDLWNAAQRQMVRTGWMHGYMRMYWAKRLLEWTATADEALVVGIRLNDRWELDGRDPNGYAGMAWSVGGVHDRAWGQRAVFGKVRFMGRASTRRKFDSKAYIKAHARDGEEDRP